MRTTTSLMLAAVATLSLGAGAAMARDAGANGYYGAAPTAPAASGTAASRYYNYQANATRHGYAGSGSAGSSSLPGLMGGGG